MNRRTLLWMVPLLMLPVCGWAQAVEELCPVVKVSSGVIAGQRLSGSYPNFGPIMQETHISGGLVAHVVMGCDGHVREISIVSGPAVFRQAMIDAVQQWVYRPYVIDGKPVAVETTVTAFAHGGALAEIPLPPGRVRVSADVMLSQRIKGENPVLLTGYHVTPGALVMHAIIGRDGHVQKLTWITGEEALRGSTMEAVRGWEYKPYLLNGEAVEVDTTIIINIGFGG